MATVTAIPPRVQNADLTAQQIFERTKLRELQLSRLLMFYISGGLLFMLLPGTFLGVWNLISISGRRAAESISPAWIQAHGQEPNLYLPDYRAAFAFSQFRYPHRHRSALRLYYPMGERYGLTLFR
jgi:hypothetical protein